MHTEQSEKGGNDEFSTVVTFMARWARLENIGWTATGKALAVTKNAIPQAIIVILSKAKYLYSTHFHLVNHKGIMLFNL